MYSKIKILGHPVHPMIVAFPMAFYTAAFACFLSFRFFTDNYFWFRVGLIANLAGIFTAALAAIPGFMDWALGIPKATAAYKTGLIHMGFNLTALLAFTLNAALQTGRWMPSSGIGMDATTAVLLSGAGVACTLVAGFYGWKMVQTHKVGVNLSVAQERLERGLGESKILSHTKPYRRIM